MKELRWFEFIDIDGDIQHFLVLEDTVLALFESDGEAASGWVEVAINE